MFEQQKIVIESGEGKDHFKAEISLDTMADSDQTSTVMGTLRQMQQDRMEWASKQFTRAPEMRRE